MSPARRLGVGPCSQVGAGRRFTEMDHGELIAAGGGRLTLSLLSQDLGGYICLRGLLTADEVQRLNDALDAMTEGDEVQVSESYARESPLMRGAANALSIVARTLGRPDNAQLVEAMEAAGYPSADNSRQNGPMGVEELEGILRALALPGRARLSDAEIDDILGQVEKTPDGSVTTTIIAEAWAALV